MDLIKLWTLCTTNGIIVDKKQIDVFERFARDLVYWNNKVNLISRKDEENVFQKHILHSLTLLKYVDFKPKANVLDVGTGGGFPGIPLGIARPDLHLLLIDSIAKKIKMTDMFAKHTELKLIKVMRARAEELQEQKQYLQSFDYIVSRAVAKSSSIMKWTSMLLKPGGSLVLLKGGFLDTELEELKEDFPDAKTEVIPISVLGDDWFEKEDKKIVKITI
jgi:16S rRNA (guanine527-N7)-methyltransferase